MTEQLNDVVDTKERDLQRPHKLWSGWQKVVAMSCIFNTIALILNCTLLIWARSRPKSANDSYIIWQGSFESMERVDTFLHLGINIVSTVILAGSNYASQVLISPTRKNIDQAHCEKRSLVIGISSLRNWHYLSQSRRLLYVFMFIITIPIHLLYNSIIFSSAANIDSASNVVTRDFLQIPPGHEFLDDIWDSARNNEWINMTLDDCVSAHVPVGKGLIVEYSNFLWFSNLSSTLQNSSWFYAGPITNGSLADPYSLCTYSAGLPNGTHIRNTTFVAPGTWLTSTSPIIQYGSTLQEGIDTNLASHILVCTDPNMYNQSSHPNSPLYEYTQGSVPAHLQYCLAKRADLSTVELVPQLLIIVIACNILKVVALSLLVFSSFKPIISIGDAVASFLDQPDSTTKNLGPISVTDLQKQRSTRNPVYSIHDKPWKVSQRYYFNAATTLRWCLTLALCILYCLFSTVFATQEQNGWSGIGVINYALLGTVFSGTTINLNSTTLIGSILLANIPQLVLSSIYLCYNALFTCMSLSAEWLRYCRHKKGLRVSRPEGEQRTTYFLSLPYKYSIPLVMKSVLLHWISSQSVFVYQVIDFDSDGSQSLKSALTNTAIGISKKGLYIGAILGGGLVLISIALGFRKLNSSMPLARSNSTVISAACHQNTVEEGRLAIKKLQYGVISEELPSGRYRVGFSNDEVRPLIPGEFYE